MYFDRINRHSSITIVVDVSVAELAMESKIDIPTVIWLTEKAHCRWFSLIFRFVFSLETRRILSR
jgi:hypothetical protein